MAKDDLSGKLAVILHADVAGSTQLVQQDEQLAHERIQDAFGRFSDTIGKYHGHVQELRGDALLAEFERASDAVTAVLAFQSNHHDHLAKLNDEIRPRIRVGIALGEVVIADNTITGAGVVLAQRVEQLANPGGLCITAAIHEALSKRFPFELDNLGEQNLKGFDHSVRVYRVSLSPGSTIPAPDQSRPISKSRTTHRVLATVTALVLLVAAGFVLWVKPWQTREQPASVDRMKYPLPEKPSIAVLPFDSLSNDPDQAFFADAITRDIILDLSRFGDLVVIAAKSTFIYKGQPVKVQQVAEDLGIRYVVEGSIQKVGGKLRINAQFVDAITGEHLWVERYDRNDKDIFAVQDEITRKIATTLGSWSGQVIEAARARAMSKNAIDRTAYEHLLHALELGQHFKKAENAEARSLLEKAIELEPRYARAYATLAWTHYFDATNNWTDSRETSIEHAFTLAKKAVELDENEAEAYWILAAVYQRLLNQPDQARAAYEQALLLNPNHADIMAHLGDTMPYWKGKAQEGIELVKKAMRLNPSYPNWYEEAIAFASYVARKHEDADAAYRKVVKHHEISMAGYAANFARLGRMKEANAQVQKLLQLNPEFSIENFILTNPFESPEDRDYFVDGLIMAGIPERLPTKLPEKPSIAVLPFTNMSSDAEQEYFADGITEDLITDISKISGLQVIARHSTFSYKGQNPDVRNVGKELGATHVIEGSVRKAGNTVRITIQLINAFDGKHIWAERYDRELRDVFAIQDEVIGEIIAALSLRLTPEEEKRVAKHDTENLEAYDMFMRGRQQEAFFTKESFIEAQRYYEQAVALDSNYAEAWARLAQIHALNGQFGWVEDLLAANQRALSLVEKSLILDSDSPFIRYGYSRILARESIGQHDRAIEEAKRAIELDPNYADAHAWLGQLYILTGQAQKTISPITMAMRINPNYPFWYDYTYGYAHYFLGEFDKAVENIELAVDRNPNVYFTRLAYAASLAMAGSQDDAEWQIDELSGMGFNKTRDELIQEHPIRDLTYRKLYDEGLRKAGLP